MPGYFRECIAATDWAGGSSVTMPFKVSIIPELDGVTEEGRCIGAVNTLFTRPGTGGKWFPDRLLVGTNTDCIGVATALQAAVDRRPDVKASLEARLRDTYDHRPAGLVIGGGGTTRAAVFALHKILGCGTIYLLNRDPDEVAAVVAHFAQVDPGCTLVQLDPFAATRGTGAVVPVVSYIVGAIPDFPAVTEAEKAVRQTVVRMLQVADKGVLLDMCYKPRHTTILKLAEQEGWCTIDGTEAMVHQGVMQVALWTGMAPEQVNYDGLAELIKTADEIQQTGAGVARI